MLLKEVKEYSLDFLFLGFFFLLAVAAFFFNPYDIFFREGVIVFAGGVYFLWGIFHHRHKKDLSLKVALEYLLLAIFGVLTAIFVLRRI